ncbi:mycofactocin biosynthesis glycosyltransferase MftF [Nocardia terpenica]|uniref:Mycofactocin system glycosyltransferase n=1 Tax=Nocardia terpenica TaxID=455432 RepID=A0A164JRU2_9NOCA|nr:mycofactocin biosynthesis glycosyltransferase MftF [Nocardia terpenica]KZM70667.1 mycofactocin system glycosyltransferase [Nocardia terpenica]MBF6060256.1 mycofactocin biosynthesis glycosyltransferase MftF [Nocardia terpenica]MBF6103516.1 mycofactocin biosynthesis glycosyltransferase MftF [Nocardia terpenica]MBF6112110.1 mycofactocin biosynthesis glycosyltransferase MftF [Nocardia terpenica]MBF6117737.1 mycofactocin biosynthesis glycosyltransferase MftF [Nocardia terpenica]
MRHDRLPDGFGVRIDPRVRTYSGGRFLVGGSPTRLLRLAPEAAALIGDGYLEVTDPTSAVVARRLLDSGVGNPRPRLLPSPEDVTVVVPHYNDAAGLERLLGTLRGHSVVVVDDGSDRPVPIPRTRGRCRVTVLRHDRRHGAAAARNAGLRAATTEFVAFLDSDVVPRAGWLEVMLGHFSDPEVALVAPRIVAREQDTTVLGRYEQARSSLDRGRREAAVTSRGAVSYVPGAALLVRRRALLAEGGFDEGMRSAADIDLCWRLEQAGWRLRYEPAAHVACDHPVSVGKWFGRKVSHGASAAPLAGRHAGMATPLSVPFWTVVATALLASGSRRGVLIGVLTLAAALARLRRVFAELDNPTRVAAIQLARGFSAGVWRIVSALCRHYWPVTVLAMVASRRIRRIAFTLAVADGLADWFTHRETGGLDPLRYLFCKRLDDLAYGTGLWWGAVRARNVAALRPVVPRH